MCRRILWPGATLCSLGQGSVGAETLGCHSQVKFLLLLLFCDEMPSAHDAMGVAWEFSTDGNFTMDWAKPVQWFSQLSILTPSGILSIVRVQWLLQGCLSCLNMSLLAEQDVLSLVGTNLYSIGQLYCTVSFKPKSEGGQKTNSKGILVLLLAKDPFSGENSLFVTVQLCILFLMAALWPKY